MVDTWFHQQTSAWGGPPTSPNIPDAPSGSAPGDFFAAQSSWRSWRGGHGSCSTQSSRVFCSAVQRSNCSSVSWSQPGISDRWRFLLSNIDKSMARSVNQFTSEKVGQDCFSKIVTWSIHKISKPWFNLLGSTRNCWIFDCRRAPHPASASTTCRASRWTPRAESFGRPSNASGGAARVNSKRSCKSSQDSGDGGSRWQVVYDLLACYNYIWYDDYIMLRYSKI